MPGLGQGYWNPERLKVLRRIVHASDKIGSKECIDAVCAAFPECTRVNVYHAIWSYSTEIEGPPSKLLPREELEARFFSLEPEVFLHGLSRLLTAHSGETERGAKAKKPDRGDAHVLESSVRIRDLRRCNPEALRRMRVW